ncbi:hypothetical protein MMPV_009121 [Pyropia vietnamensis]
MGAASSKGGGAPRAPAGVSALRRVSGRLPRTSSPKGGRNTKTVARPPPPPADVDESLRSQGDGIEHLLTSSAYPPPPRGGGGASRSGRIDVLATEIEEREEEEAALPNLEEVRGADPARTSGRLQALVDQFGVEAEAGACEVSAAAMEGDDERRWLKGGVGDARGIVYPKPTHSGL